MKAMILAAGLGTRLEPLTRTTPKALVTIGEKTMLEIVLRRLAEAGVDGFAVNVFHLADAIEKFLKERGNFGFDIRISREEALLNTGGGLKNAAALVNDGKPFFIHNVDVLSDINLAELYRAHVRSQALATLAVQRRQSKRPLLFNARGRLVGRGEGQNSLAFCGISVASPALFSKLTETGAFSLSDAYVRLAQDGERVEAYPCGDAYWQDIGSLEKLEAARRRARHSRGPNPSLLDVRDAEDRA